MGSLWVLSSAVCGHLSWIYLGLGEIHESSVTLRSAFLYSRIVFVLFVVLNILLRVNSLRVTVPFYILLVLVVWWFGISLSLSLIGEFIGYEQAEGLRTHDANESNST